MSMNDPLNIKIIFYSDKLQGKLSLDVSTSSAIWNRIRRKAEDVKKKESNEDDV